MQKEPVAIGEIVRLVLMVAGLLGWSQVGDAVESVGGVVAVVSAAAVISGLISYFVRNRVSPE